MGLKEKFEAWAIKRNKKCGRRAKLDKMDKMIIKIFFGFIPRMAIFLLIIAIAMRGYEKYGIERTMIVISWIGINIIMRNFKHLHKSNQIMMNNQLEFFKKYDARKDSKNRGKSHTKTA